MNIAEFKKMSPAYAEMADGQLAFKIWNKFYKDQIPMGMFADKIELDKTGFNEMVAAAQEDGYEPTSRTTALDYVPEGARASAYLQGATLGFGDEMLSSVMAAKDVATGQAQDFGSSYEGYQSRQKQMLQDYRQNAPGEAVATEIAGAVMSPANLLRAPAAIQSLGPTTRAGLTGATTGAVYGAGTAEGGLEKRAEGALEMAVPGALFGVGTQKVIQTGNKTLQAVMNRSVQKPTMDTLRAAKNEAYKVVDKSGVRFDKNDMATVLQQSMRELSEANFVPEVDRQSLAALKAIQMNQGKSVTLGELDKLRQGLWKRYNAAPNEVGIRGMIDAIDDVIESKSAANQAMQIARAANSRFKKAELLDEAFKVAERQAADSGSGGNILNKYKQAVSSIMNNPKKAKWFSDAEKEAMDRFIKGSFGQNMMRLVGKLSPSGNGLMAALHFFSASVNPTTLAGAGAGIAAKTASDVSGRKGAQALVEMAGGGRIPTAPQYIPGAGTAGAVGGILNQEQ
jgi:hypothetical protein